MAGDRDGQTKPCSPAAHCSFSAEAQRGSRWRGLSHPCSCRRGRDSEFGPPQAALVPTGWSLCFSAPSQPHRIQSPLWKQFLEGRARVLGFHSTQREPRVDEMADVVVCSHYRGTEGAGSLSCPLHPQAQEHARP